MQSLHPTEAHRQGLCCRHWLIAGFVLMALFLGVPPLYSGSDGHAGAPEKIATPNGFGPPEQIGTIADPAISEISGLAVSTINPDIFWAINDSFNPPVLYALTQSGQTMGRYTIAGASNIDWEAIALFAVNDTSYLMIADVGDNNGRHDHRTLYIVREPIIKTETDGVLELQGKIRFRYEDGPRDCEAVTVDVPGQQILLLSKRDKPPGLYALPLDFSPALGQPDAPGLIQTARKIAVLSTLPPLTKKDRRYKYGSYAFYPTDMVLSPDGALLTILTYTDIYQYQRAAGQNWAATLQEPPIRIALPHPSTGLLKQREGLARQPLTGALFITSEGKNAPIFRVRPTQKTLTQ